MGMDPSIQPNSKFISIETTLRESLSKLKELENDFNMLQMQCNSYRTEYTAQTERCESKTCNSAISLKEVIATKDSVIQFITSTFIKYNETKDLNIFKDIVKTLFGDSMILTPPKDSPEYTSEKCSKIPKTEPGSPEKDVSFKDESVSEIEGTPTGRISPIIQMRKSKTMSGASVEVGDKKKCPSDWPTPNKKTLKLSITTPKGSKCGGKLRQARLNLVKMKPQTFIDLSKTPEFLGGVRKSTEKTCNIQPNIKEEVIDNDETILPSPTCESSYHSQVYTSTDACEFKSPQKLEVKIKKEDENRLSLDNVRSNEENDNFNEMEDSINILQPKLNRFVKAGSPQKATAIGVQVKHEVCEADTNNSMSLLHQVNIIERSLESTARDSPSKRPLAENINVVNVTSDHKTRPAVRNKLALNNKRKTPEKVEQLFKDPPIKKKAERRALPGWSCAECRDFYGVLYKDNPEMLAQKMTECSRHRSTHQRPLTPEGFWNVRWDVPENTEEFNRRNNAI